MSESSELSFSTVDLSELQPQSTSLKLLVALPELFSAFFFTTFWMTGVGVLTYLCAFEFSNQWVFLIGLHFLGLVALGLVHLLALSITHLVGVKAELHPSINGAVVRWRRLPLASVVLAFYVFQIFVGLIPPFIGLMAAAISHGASLPVLGVSSVLGVGLGVFVHFLIPGFRALLDETCENELTLSFQKITFEKNNLFFRETGTLDPQTVEVQATQYALNLSPPQIHFSCGSEKLSAQIEKVVSEVCESAKRQTTPEQPIPESLRKMLQPTPRKLTS